MYESLFTCYKCNVDVDYWEILDYNYAVKGYTFIGFMLNPQTNNMPYNFIGVETSNKKREYPNWSNASLNKWTNGYFRSRCPACGWVHRENSILCKMVKKYIINEVDKNNFKGIILTPYNIRIFNEEIENK